VLRKILILGTTRDKTTRNWRKWHNVKLLSFYFSFYVFSVFISRTIGWLVIGKLLERKEKNTGLDLWCFKERDHLEYRGLIGRWYVNMDWIHLVQGRGNSRAVLKTITKLLDLNRNVFFST